VTACRGSEGNKWSGSVLLPRGIPSFEYKYLVTNADQSRYFAVAALIVWAPFPFHVNQFAVLFGRQEAIGVLCWSQLQPQWICRISGTLVRAVRVNRSRRLHR
jgi:hypothetical protein